MIGFFTMTKGCCSWGTIRGKDVRNVDEDCSNQSVKSYSDSPVKSGRTDCRSGTGKGNVARRFTLLELANLTEDGDSGKVYKGQLQTGQTIMVKQLNPEGLQGNREFVVEILMLSLLHHPNLLTLFGYCIDGDQKLLVYEYMPMGSLEHHLFDLDDQQTPLNWKTRTKIALGAAHGLEYLHRKVIYHQLKSANILLDHDFNPKLSDFGLAKFYSLGKRSPKSDIYSFGVVLLELITGRKAMNNETIVAWCRPFLKDKRRFLEMVDPSLKGEFPVSGMHHMIAIAAMCIQDEPKFRPLICDIVVAIEYVVTQS